MTSSAGSARGGYEFKWRDPSDAKKKWESFAKFGNATATEMTGKNFDKWLKDAGIIDSKAVTTTMTGIAFSKVTGAKKKATFDETKRVIATVAEDKAKNSKRDVQVEIDEICRRLERLDSPVVKNTAKSSTEGNVYSRLTDHTKYTGAHKERFDAEGKGKGKAGRVDTVEETGYVSAYKNHGTYDQKHQK